MSSARVVCWGMTRGPWAEVWRFVAWARVVGCLRCRECGAEKFQWPSKGVERMEGKERAKESVACGGNGEEGKVEGIMWLGKEAELRDGDVWRSIA